MPRYFFMSLTAEITALHAALCFGPFMTADTAAAVGLCDMANCQFPGVCILAEAADNMNLHPDTRCPTNGLRVQTVAVLVT